MVASARDRGRLGETQPAPPSGRESPRPRPNPSRCADGDRDTHLTLSPPHDCAAVDSMIQPPNSVVLWPPREDEHELSDSLGLCEPDRALLASDPP